MKIEEHKSTPRCDILLGGMPHGKALAASGFPKDGNVHGAAAIAQLQPPLGHLSIGHAESEVERSPFFPHPCSALLKAVPNACNNFFDKVKHEVIFRVRMSESVTRGMKEVRARN